MSVTPLRSVEPTPPTPPDQGAAPPERRGHSGKAVSIAVLATVVLLTTFIVGIVIGSAARKRFEKWNRGY